MRLHKRHDHVESLFTKDLWCIALNQIRKRKEVFSLNLARVLPAQSVENARCENCLGNRVLICFVAPRLFKCRQVTKDQAGVLIPKILVVQSFISDPQILKP